MIREGCRIIPYTESQAALPNGSADVVLYATHSEGFRASTTEKTLQRNCASDPSYNSSSSVYNAHSDNSSEFRDDDHDIDTRNDDDDDDDGFDVFQIRLDGVSGHETESETRPGTHPTEPMVEQWGPLGDVDYGGQSHGANEPADPFAYLCTLMPNAWLSAPTSGAPVAADTTAMRSTMNSESMLAEYVDNRDFLTSSSHSLSSSNSLSAPTPAAMSTSVCSIPAASQCTGDCGSGHIQQLPATSQTTDFKDWLTGTLADKNVKLSLAAACTESLCAVGIDTLEVFADVSEADFTDEFLAEIGITKDTYGPVALSLRVKLLKVYEAVRLAGGRR